MLLAFLLPTFCYKKKSTLQDLSAFLDSGFLCFIITSLERNSSIFASDLSKGKKIHITVILLQNYSTCVRPREAPMLIKLKMAVPEDPTAKQAQLY